jgi:hypothetical protein
VGEFIPGARFPPFDQSAGAGYAKQRKLFSGGSWKIAKVVAAAKMPEHGINVATLLLDTHKNTHPTQA